MATTDISLRLTGATATRRPTYTLSRRDIRNAILAGVVAALLLVVLAWLTFGWISLNSDGMQQSAFPVVKNLREGVGACFIA
jgi:hypothetical protein